MKKLFSGLVVLSLLGVLSGCSQDDTQRLTLTGSSTVAPLAGDIAKRYEATHPDVRIDVQTGGSSRGINDARKGLADIGMVSRALKEQEQDLHNAVIARDGIAIIVHHSNSVSALSDDQIRAIYTGQHKNWQELGGEDRPITVVHKAEGRSTLELFLKYMGLKNQEVKANIIIGDNEQGLKTVSLDSNAIGYVSVGAAEYHARQHGSVRLLPLNGIEASTATVADGSFPLSRPLNFVIKGEPSGLAKDFIEFARSSDVNDIIQQHYFVPLR